MISDLGNKPTSRIANDLLGVIVGGDDEHWNIKDEEGKVHKVSKLHVHEIKSRLLKITMISDLGNKPTSPLVSAIQTVNDFSQICVMFSL